jgi:predicted RNA-binding Zn ribbon-like protein
VPTSRATAAPDQLTLVETFLNTIDYETGADALGDVHAAQKWLAARRLSSPGTEYDEADRRRLVDVRGALRGLVAANGGSGVHRRAVTTLNEAARRVRLGVRLHPDDGYRLMAEGVGIDRPIGEVLISVTGSMAAGSWNRLKICANDACQLAFFDSSRNRSGRWCSMAKCGNRMKGRAYRERHATGATEGSGRRMRAEAAS